MSLVSHRSPPANFSPTKFESVALLLQGGGALGAYQAGVYEGLAHEGIHPNWVAGISIGAINCGHHCRQSPGKAG